MTLPDLGACARLGPIPGSMLQTGPGRIEAQFASPVLRNRNNATERGPGQLSVVSEIEIRFFFLASHASRDAGLWEVTRYDPPWDGFHPDQTVEILLNSLRWPL